MKKIQIVHAAAFALATGLYGCGGSDESTAASAPAVPAAPAAPAMPNGVPMPGGLTGELQEKMIEVLAAQQGVDADVEFSGDGMTMKVNDAEHGEVNVGYGAQAKLPDSVPDDVPVYAGLALNMVNEMAAQEMLMIMGSSEDSIDTIAAFYKEQAAAKGWELTTENQVPGMAHTLMYEKGERVLQVVLGPGPTGGTQLSLNTGKK